MIAFMDALTPLEMALSANLVATDARTATADGSRCQVCGRLVQPGQRIADLVSGGTVHVVRCSRYAGTA